jgi:4-amino-4-deoxy-L-arabinose transferase-like glycosyltransferase
VWVVTQRLPQTTTGARPGPVPRAAQGITRAVESRWTIPLAAFAAFVLRLPGLGRPIRPDEAGFTLVARSWAPEADSVYGHYFVDRPPLLISVFKLSDAIGGPAFIRVLGALACAALVLLAARTARVIAGDTAARWTAICVAAITSSTLINLVAVKGELLGLPFVMAACLLAVLSLRDRSVPLAVLAGMSATVAVGFKQNLLGGLVFAGTLLLVALITRRVEGRTFLRLAGAGLAGAAVPVAAMLAWAAVAGVRPGTLWYAIYGFRADASAVLASHSSKAADERAVTLVVIALCAGLLLVLGGFVVHLRGELRDDAPLAAATAAMLAYDALGMVLGGSFWPDYLFALVPSAALAAALLSRHRSGRGRAMRAVIVLAALSCVVSLCVWAVYNLTGSQETDEARTGTAIGEVAEPGDTLTVFGGRADLQMSSGLDSPYEQLWSLPMRTLDPDLADLRALVSGPDAPTWLVEWFPFTSWNREAGELLRRDVEERYVPEETRCGDGEATIWRLRDVERPPARPDC